MTIEPILIQLWICTLTNVTVMKHSNNIFRLALILSLIFIGPLSSAQNDTGKDIDTQKEMEELRNSFVKMAGTVFRFANQVVSGIGSEIKEFKKDIEECCPEFYEVRDSLKAQTKKGLEHCRREIHRGFRQGLRGESYDPTKE